MAGTVIRTGAVKMLESEVTLECSKCGHRFHVHADFMQHYTIPMPSICPSDEGGA